MATWLLNSGFAQFNYRQATRPPASLRFAPCDEVRLTIIDRHLRGALHLGGAKADIFLDHIRLYNILAIKTLSFIMPMIIDTDFQVQRAIRGGQDPVPSPFARPAQAKCLSGLSPILSNAVFTEKLIKFDLYDYRRDKSVKSIRLGILDNRGFHMPPSKEFTVGETGGFALIFNKESGDYRVQGEPRP